MAGEFVDRTSVESFSAEGSTTRPLETINPNAPVEPTPGPQEAPEAPSPRQPFSLHTPLEDPNLESARLDLLRDYTQKTTGAAEQRLRLERRAQEIEDQQRQLEAQAESLRQYEQMARLGYNVSQDPELAAAALERGQSRPQTPSFPETMPAMTREVAEVRRELAELYLEQAFSSVRTKYPDFAQRESDVVNYVVENKLIGPGMKAPQIQKILEGAHALMTRDTRNAAADAAAQRKLVDQATQAQAARTVPGSGIPAPPSEPSIRRDDGTPKSYEELAQELTKR